LTRRFIIVEAVYANYGDLAKLDEIFKLKEKYCWRLMVEESYSVGVLGTTGRGVCEHWGLPTSEVDVRCASMGNSFGTIGECSRFTGLLWRQGSTGLTCSVKAVHVQTTKLAQNASRWDGDEADNRGSSQSL
jgi:hypothetical protein